MHFQVPHNTTKTEAMQKVKDALDEARPHMRDEMKLTSEKWEGTTFYFDLLLQGKSITGTVEVTETDFVVDAKLPLMWRMFEGRIEKEIQKHVFALT